ARRPDSKRGKMPSVWRARGGLRARCTGGLKRAIVDRSAPPGAWTRRAGWAKGRAGHGARRPIAPFLARGPSARLTSCPTTRSPSHGRDRSHRPWRSFSMLRPHLPRTPRRAGPHRIVRNAPLALALFALLSPRAARAATPRVHAIVGARIVVSPGHVIEHGTIVMRDGVITAVGENAAVPGDARVWKGDSLTVYPGLIDAFVMPNEPPPGAQTSGGPPGRPQPAPQPPRGAVHELATVRPETRMVESPPPARDQVE